MKRMFIILLSVLFVITFSGCTKQTNFAEDNLLETDENGFDKEGFYVAENDDEVIEEETEEETEPPQLSSECDYILCDGYYNDDYYELVATLEEDYPESIYKIGVIKNNEWLVKLSKKSPFIDKDGRWKGVESYERNSVSEDDFKYLGEGCFYYKATRGQIIYNPETKVWFNTANISNKYGQDGIIDFNEIVNNRKFIAQEWEDLKFKLLNLKTGEAKTIGGYFEDSLNYPDRIYKYSDGLFLAIHYSTTLTKSFKGFFNTDGKMIINLTDYTIFDYYDGYFEDGEYTFKTVNDTGKNYNLTINKKGKIIKKEKI